MAQSLSAFLYFMKKIDLIGVSFGRLTILNQYFDKNGKFLECACSCGNYVIVRDSNRKSGSTNSCGCLRMGEGNPMFKHGHKSNGVGSPEYYSWESMKSRCYYPSHKSYKDYGGKGVTVCDRWLNSFELFLKDMSTRPSMSHTLDRYPIINGNYEPTNCRWATKKQQAEGRSSTRWEYDNGVKMTQSDWARYFSIHVTTLREHLKTKKISDIREYYIKKGKFTEAIKF